MKKGRFITMLTLAGILLALSCEKEKPVPMLPYEEVFGNWDWFSTRTGWGVTTYADSVDYTQTLEVTAQGKYIWKQNDTILHNDIFTVDVDTVEGNEIFFFLFSDSNRVDQAFYIQKPDTLIMTDQCADCNTYMFTRH